MPGRWRRPWQVADSIPYFLRAVDIDSNFAEGYTTLSRIYSNLGETERAREYAKLAYERREHVDEHERLSIAYQYHYEVTGDQSRANESLELWKRSFPLEFRPVNSLALVYNFLGRFDRAIVEGTEAVRRNPAHGYPYSNLAQAYCGSGRLDAARKTAEQAVALGIETMSTRRLLYQLAVMAGDDSAAMKHLEWARDRPREFEMVGARAQASGWAGKVGDARRLYEDAARMAEGRNLPDVGTSHFAWASWTELVCGNIEKAAQLARGVLDREPSYDPRLRAALILALTGADCEAEAIANELAATNPDHTFINSVLGTDRQSRHRPRSRATRPGDGAPSRGRALRARVHCRPCTDIPSRTVILDDRLGSRGGCGVPTPSRLSWQRSLLAISCRRSVRARTRAHRVRQRRRRRARI